MISFVLLAIMLATQFISILHRNKIVIDQNPPDISVAEPKVDISTPAQRIQHAHA
jgi:hypothetical protein